MLGSLYVWNLLNAIETRIKTKYEYTQAEFEYITAGNSLYWVANTKQQRNKNKKNDSIHDAIWRHMTEPTLLQFAVSSCPPTD